MPNQTIRIELPGPPQGKGRPRFRVVKTKAGAEFVGAYTPAATRSYEAMLRYSAEQAMAGRSPLDAPLKVRMVATFGPPGSWSGKKRAEAIAGWVRPTGRPDSDNLVKTLDAFNGIVWRDDSLVVELVVEKWYGEKPSLRVDVSEFVPGILSKAVGAE